MSNYSHIPQSFSIAHKTSKEFIQINFQFIQGTSIPEWCGYYQERRIALRPMATEWVSEVLTHGIACAIFRYPKSAPTLNDVEILVSCACYYIDFVAK